MLPIRPESPSATEELQQFVVNDTNLAKFAVQTAYSIVMSDETLPYGIDQVMAMRLGTVVLQKGGVKYPLPPFSAEEVLTSGVLGLLSITPEEVTEAVNNLSKIVLETIDPAPQQPASPEPLRPQKPEKIKAPDQRNRSRESGTGSIKEQVARLDAFSTEHPEFTSTRLDKAVVGLVLSGAKLTADDILVALINTGLVSTKKLAKEADLKDRIKNVMAATHFLSS